MIRHAEAEQFLTFLKMDRLRFVRKEPRVADAGVRSKKLPFGDIMIFRR